MEKKRIVVENSLHQKQEFGIYDHENHVVLGTFLSREIEQVEVPATANGKPVTAIGDNCFFNCVDMQTVSLPNSITDIGVQAFAMCKSLIELELPDSITNIGAYAFRDCRGLQKVVLPNNLKRLSQGLFSFCYLNNPEIILPEGLEVIERSAFWSAGTFDLRIPDSVKEIGVGAFYLGPSPITVLPYDKGWFSEWPYGELVECSDGKGRITDIHYLDHNCRLYEVAVNTEVKDYFYPCDWLDGNIFFTEAKTQQQTQKEIEKTWKSQRELSDAYKLRDFWRQGLVVPR